MKRELSILILDDDRSMTHTLADILLLDGYRIVEAGSGIQALEFCRRQRFDCVLSDIRMSDMDGVEFFRILQKEQPCLPVVLMTAYTNDEIIRNGMEEGIVGVLNKPLNIPDLLVFLSELKQSRILIILDEDLDDCSELSATAKWNGFSIEMRSTVGGGESWADSVAQVIFLKAKFDSFKNFEEIKSIAGQFSNQPVVLIMADHHQMLESIYFVENSTNISVYHSMTASEFLCVLECIHLDQMRKAFSCIDSTGKKDS